MSATFGFNDNGNNIGNMGPNGYKVDVPENDIARLMYYLSCISTLINYSKKDDKYTDYEHYSLLTARERLKLIELIALYNPKLFIDAGIIIIDTNLLPDGTTDNQFYEITDQRIGFHDKEEIMIDGKSMKILKIMACNTDWLNRNYICPLNNIINSPPPMLKSNNKSKQNHETSSKMKKNEDGCCSIF